MIIGITGYIGAGKTWTLSVLGSYLAEVTGYKLYSDYGLYNSLPISSLPDLSVLFDGVLCLDEFWLSADSRRYKEKLNLDISEWILQTRKQGLCVLFTAHNLGQVDLRVRTATDILVYVERRSAGSIRLYIIDYHTGSVGRCFQVNNPSEFYYLFDTSRKMSKLKVA